MAAKSDLDRLNELIDWYEKFKPNAGAIIQTRFTEAALDKFAEKQASGRWLYRNRMLERVTTRES